MENDSKGLKIALVSILGVFVATVCVCLVYLVFFKDNASKEESSASVRSEGNSSDQREADWSKEQSYPAQGEGSAEESSSSQSSREGSQESVSSEQAYEDYVWETKKFRGYEISLDSEKYKGLTFGGVESVELTLSGKAILHCTAEVGEVYGLTYEVETGVLQVFCCGYGNGGFGVIFFVMEDGTIKAIDPSAMIHRYKIQMITDFGEAKNIISIDRGQDGEQAGLILATDIDGEVYVLDSYLS